MLSLTCYMLFREECFEVIDDDQWRSIRLIKIARSKRVSCGRLNVEKNLRMVEGTVHNFGHKLLSKGFCNLILHLFDFV